MKKILVLNRNHQRLVDIRNFLKAHAYQVTASDSIRNATQIIVEERPDYFLVSTDDLPMDCQWLLGILNRLTHVILYCDRVSAHSLSITRNLNGSYLIEPPFTVFGLRQTLFQIKREQKLQDKLVLDLDQTQIFIMSVLSDLSLKVTCRPYNPSIPTVPLHRSHRLNVFRVQTSSLFGYLVLAHAQNQPFEQNWLEQLQGHLVKHLQFFHERLFFSNDGDLTIEEFSIENWSKQRADYVLRSLDLNSEVALAFIKDRNPLAFKTSSQSDHIEMDLKHIPENEPLDFDVYVYLEQNAKFVLHTPKGNELSPAKKKRLKDDGYSSVHIPKKSLERFISNNTRKFFEKSSEEFR